MDLKKALKEIVIAKNTDEKANKIIQEIHKK